MGGAREVDAADLKLQNLQYEKGYFLREIRQARDYPPDRPIDMLETAGARRDAVRAHVDKFQLSGVGTLTEPPSPIPRDPLWTQRTSSG